MNYEQKYNKALDRARDLLSQCINDRDRLTKVYRVEDIESIFPELIESEDERIRKALISILKSDFEEDTTIFGISIGKIVGWLERQGDRPNNVYDKELSEILGRVIRRYTNNPNIPYVEREKVSKEIIPYVESLEGQGSQILDNSAKTCKDEQKSTDKVEPKFKVGEWLRYRAAEPFLVEEITEQGYINGNSCLLFEWENEIHLWTIQDAKEGDVLTGSYGTFIFLGKSGGYCGVLNDYTFIRSTGNNEMTKGLHPATKEQRDVLIKAMTDAGWEFDFQKKELKKIESEIEIPFGAKDSELQEVTYYIPKGFHAEIDDDKVVIKKGKKPTAWSIEDISKVQRICMYLDEAKKYYANITEVRECIDWLKSLKDRVLPKQEWSEEDERLFEDIEEAISKSSWGEYDKKLHISFLKHFRPQPKQEWSEEDENHAIGITQTVDCAIRHNLISQKTGDIQISWLKSLKDRYTWKPNDKQIRALHYMNLTGNISYAGQGQVLIELYNDLKKLKGEEI